MLLVNFPTHSSTHRFSKSTTSEPWRASQLAKPASHSTFSTIKMINHESHEKTRKKLNAEGNKWYNGVSAPKSPLSQKLKHWTKFYLVTVRFPFRKGKPVEGLSKRNQIKFCGLKNKPPSLTFRSKLNGITARWLKNITTISNTESEYRIMK